MRAVPIYHGRKVLAALFMAGFMVYGGGLYCFVLLVPPLTAEFQDAPECAAAPSK